MYLNNVFVKSTFKLKVTEHQTEEQRFTAVCGSVSPPVVTSAQLIQQRAASKLLSSLFVF